GQPRGGNTKKRSVKHYSTVSEEAGRCVSSSTSCLSSVGISDRFRTISICIASPERAEPRIRDSRRSRA
ncbi:hypothetical protein PENTCL1PPCAC_29909, partial [Pristionchus entomophagus]